MDNLHSWDGGATGPAICVQAEVHHAVALRRAQGFHKQLLSEKERCLLHLRCNRLLSNFYLDAVEVQESEATRAVR